MSRQLLPQLQLFANPRYNRHMSHALVLNASFEPLHIVSWQRAIQLLFQGKVEVVEESDQVPAITTLFAVTATVILFASDLHLEMVKGLVDSYATIPPGTGFVSRPALVDVTDQLTAVFLVALRIGSPFLVYSLIVNFAVGITNKLTPQIPVYFIAVPFVLAGGLLLTFYALREFVSGFMAAFSVFILKG